MWWCKSASVETRKRLLLKEVSQRQTGFSFDQSLVDPCVDGRIAGLIQGGFAVWSVGADQKSQSKIQ
jgi:hypothetical protein